MTSIALPAKRRPRWLLLALVASLAVNAFFLGALATDWLDLGWGGKGGRGLNFELRRGELELAADHFKPDRVLRALALQDAAMDKVVAAVDAARPAAERHFDRLKELRGQLGALAAAPAPDRAAIDGQLVEIRAEIDRMLTELQRTSMDALLALPADMRAKLVEKQPAK